MAKVKIDLGEHDHVSALYSFPNDPSEVIVPRHTLKGTIERYISHSLQRDGFGATVEKVNDSGGRVSVTLDGLGADEYERMLPSYLAIGDLGLQAARKLRDESARRLAAAPVKLAEAIRPKGPKIWRYNWRFFLPHGVPMVQHHTVQLLHFPPDTVLVRDQDYLAAATTKRWAELLVVNGAQPNETHRFQNIIDIAPIAAPHNDGKLLDGSYSFFTDYINGLLKLWLPRKERRPMVAFGGPVRDWVEKKYMVEFGKTVPALQTIKLEGGHEVPTLRANHPSYIWAAVKRISDNPFTPQDEPLLEAMRIMKQDLIAACWQVKVVENPTSDPKTILSQAEDAWEGREREVAKLTYKQVWSKPDKVACCLADALALDDVKSLMRAVSDEELDVLRSIIGADEASVEPEELEPSYLRSISK